jgi:hypothetical protein
MDMKGAVQSGSERMMKQSRFRMSGVKWFDNGRRGRRGHGRLDALYGGWGKVPVPHVGRNCFMQISL